MPDTLGREVKNSVEKQVYFSFLLVLPVTLHNVTGSGACLASSLVRGFGPELAEVEFIQGDYTLGAGALQAGVFLGGLPWWWLGVWSTSVCRGRRSIWPQTSLARWVTETMLESVLGMGILLLGKTTSVGSG